jgi:chromosome segregation ATPase
MNLPFIRLVVVTLAFAALMAACGEDEAEVTETVEGIEDADDARQAADEAWASFRTDFERLGDELATDEDAQQELADACRDALEELRQADDPRADQLEAVCDNIRDADVEAEWDALREEFEQLDAGG